MSRPFGLRPCLGMTSPVAQAAREPRVFRFGLCGFHERFESKSMRTWECADSDSPDVKSSRVGARTQETKIESQTNRAGSQMALVNVRATLIEVTDDDKVRSWRSDDFKAFSVELCVLLKVDKLPEIFGELEREAMLSLHTKKRAIENLNKLIEDRKAELTTLESSKNAEQKVKSVGVDRVPNTFIENKAEEFASLRAIFDLRETLIALVDDATVRAWKGADLEAFGAELCDRLNISQLPKTFGDVEREAMLALYAKKRAATSKAPAAQVADTVETSAGVSESNAAAHRRRGERICVPFLDVRRCSRDAPADCRAR
jgi:hypothetical protein